MTTHTVSILGSLNVDFITLTPRLPAGGETLHATSFTTGYGGKGANQAVACARLRPHDVRVRMCGHVGSDSFGTDYVEALKKEGLNVGSVKRIEGAKTGIANVIVEEAQGENRILLASGANYEGWEAGADEVGDGTEVLVLQLEIPLSVVLQNMHAAAQRGVYVVFNPAPAVAIPESAYKDIDTLVLNESEAIIMAGVADTTSDGDQDLHSRNSALARKFLAKGVKDCVVITLGGAGLVYVTAKGATGTVAARKVKVVDTTAAGDTFVGAYAVERATRGGQGFNHAKALEFATRAASRTVERRGAMDAIPYRSEIEGVA